MHTEKNTNKREKRITNLFLISASGDHYAVLPATTQEYWGNWVINNQEVRLVSCNLIPIDDSGGLADVVDIRWDILPPMEGEPDRKPEEMDAAKALGLTCGR